MKTLAYVIIAAATLTSAVCAGQAPPPTQPVPPKMGPGAPGNFSTNVPSGVSTNLPPGVTTNLPPGASTNLPPGVSNTPYR
ncbi:MAG: hypothetical protein LV480_00310 [Methylacidiphilales bacterium]|nr:hypothetical protein [Candidatus Methylacidiphilales bacterium]